MNINKFITNLYKGFLNRIPSNEEVSIWSERYLSGTTIDEITDSFIESTEFLQLQKGRDLLFAPPGHFYSPIVNTQELSLVEECTYSNPISGIPLSREEQVANWSTLLPYLQKINFHQEKTDGVRYFSNNYSYGIGDASIYGAMLLQNRPNKIIEIGSGHSSACMLDMADQFLSTSPPTITFIEPYPDLLHSLLTPQDLCRVKIFDVGIQKISTDLFKTLDENDILFIDSTHVLKTGSDVCWELFEILPSLKRGVLIHIHDIFWPFEYPKSWIFDEKRSWNEIYALKAFLMYNNHFKIEFFNDYFSQTCKEQITKDYPQILPNTGGSLWLRKVK